VRQRKGFGCDGCTEVHLVADDDVWFPVMCQSDDVAPALASEGTCEVPCDGQPLVTDVAQLKWPSGCGGIGPAGYIGQTLAGDVFGKPDGCGQENVMTCGYRRPDEGDQWLHMTVTSAKVNSIRRGDVFMIRAIGLWSLKRETSLLPGRALGRRREAVAEPKQMGARL